MAPKQREMDEIVARIYSRIQVNDLANATSTLFILLGDHGMNEVGNHGGSSYGETSPALIFISKSLQVSRIGSNDS